MTDVVYSDHYKVEDSSVISDFYYRANPDDPNKGELYIQLKRDGVLCGYQAPREVYRALVLNAQTGRGSAGQDWNHFVKDHYEGFSTTDIKLVAPDVGWSKPAQRRYAVTAEVTTVVTHIVYASDLNEALKAAQHQINSDPEDKVRIVSATQFFD